MQVQIIRRNCDVCGFTEEYDMAKVETVLPLMEKWYTLAKEKEANGQLVPTVKHACSGVCATALITDNPVLMPEQIGRSN